MPAARTVHELRNVTVKEFDKLTLLLDSIPDALRLHPDGDADKMTIKDLVGHRAHWIGLFLGWYSDGLAGKPVHFPAKGYKWSDLKRFNADLRRAQRDLGWDEARQMLINAHEQLVSFIDSHDDSSLYGGPMRGANNNWTAGRWAEAAGPSHYRSAAKYLRAQLKAFKAAGPRT